MNYLRKLAGQTAIYGFSSVIARILNFLLVPFYTRVFIDTAEYGIINELYAYVAFFIIILTYGMETAFFRFSSKYTDKEIVFSTTLISLIATSGLFSVFVILFYPFLSGLIGYNEHQNFILLLGLVLSVDAITAIPFARLRFYNKSIKFALIKLFNISANIFFNVFFLVFIPWIIEQGYSNFIINFIYEPDFFVGYVFLSNLLSSLLTLCFFVKEIFSVRYRFSLNLLKSMLIYSFPLLIAGLAGTVNEVIDRIMLRYRLPEEIDALEQIGVYGANIKIAVLMTLFIQMFRYASEPFFFSSEKNIRSREMFAEVLKYFTICGIIIFLFISLNIDLFKYIIGPQYREGIVIVPVVLFGNLMLGIYFNLSMWYKLRELTYFGAIFATIGAIVTIAVNYYFIPYFGYIASAWGHLLSYTIMVFLAFFVGRYYYPVPYNIHSLLLYIFGGLFFYFVSVNINVDNILFSLILNNIFILVFTSIIIFIERRNLYKIIKNKDFK